MTGITPIVVPGRPHHVTQRGNCRATVFFEAGDFELYRLFKGETRACHRNSKGAIYICDPMQGERIKFVRPFFSITLARRKSAPNKGAKPEDLTQYGRRCFLFENDGSRTFKIYRHSNRLPSSRLRFRQTQPPVARTDHLPHPVTISKRRTARQASYPRRCLLPRIGSRAFCPAGPLRRRRPRPRRDGRPPSIRHRRFPSRQP